jgi:hypothetical protein
MEFNFNCEQVLDCNNGLAILEGTFQAKIKPGYILYVNQILDMMGYASSKVIYFNSGTRFEYSYHNCSEIFYFKS